MTPRSATPTRERLLDAAQGLINQQGFSATSIDQIIDRVGLTKGSFFYHFRTKNDLARALIDRFAERDQETLRSCMERAEKLSDDPLQQVLIFVGLLIEAVRDLDADPQPGCLFATYCYESGLFDEETKRVIAGAMLSWRTALGEKLRRAAERHPPRFEVDIDGLADMLTVVVEGAFVMTRSLRGPGMFAGQLLHYRNYLQLLFGR